MTRRSHGGYMRNFPILVLVLSCLVVHAILHHGPHVGVVPVGRLCIRAWSTLVVGPGMSIRQAPEYFVVEWDVLE